VCCVVALPLPVGETIERPRGEGSHKQRHGQECRVVLQMVGPPVVSGLVFLALLPRMHD
jgi:hypothetical protein